VAGLENQFTRDGDREFNRRAATRQDAVEALQGQLNRRVIHRNFLAKMTPVFLAGTDGVIAQAISLESDSL